MAKQYLYRIGYYSEEDSAEIVLIHERKISKKEFRNMFVEATLEILLNRRETVNWFNSPEGGYSDYSKKQFIENTYIKHEGKEYVTMEEYLEERGHQKWTNFSHIYKEVASIMVELYGFEIAVYDQDEAVNGWGGICDENRNFGKDDPLLNRIMKKFWERFKKK